MKRLITAAMSLMLVASFALAVNSENVVGYNDVVLTNGYNMLAVNFATVGAPAADIDINDFLPSGQIEVTAAGLTGKAVPTGADQVRVWNAATSVYSNYFLFKALATSNTKNYKWCLDDGGTYPVMTDMISISDAVWFIKAKAGTCAFAPQIPYTLD